MGAGPTGSQNLFSGMALALLIALALPVASIAEESDLREEIAPPETAVQGPSETADTGEVPPPIGEPDRFMLVDVDDGVLRVDRHEGTVSICRNVNGNWRCNPVPHAEDAYITEINDLAAEVERLTARLEDLNSQGADGGVPPADESAPAPGEDSSQGLSDDDEMELERMLSFTEDAMRRFFGLVRTLRDDLESKDSP